MPNSVFAAPRPLPRVRHLLVAAVLVQFATHVARAQTSGEEVAPPNIVIFIADDWGLHAGAYGTRWVNTPAFDRVAAEGVLFTKACTPKL